MAAATPEPPPEKTFADALQTGVVVIVSKPSQQMHVFANGALWRSSPVSTGKKGKETPSGVFAILQKKTFHRSNVYSNAPMPFMQRLTWDGIAIHAGHVPGYPASHGCIRLPADFAKELFDLTGFTTTGVIVTDEPVGTGQEALRLARTTGGTIPIDPAVLDPKWAEAIRLAEGARLAKARPPDPGRTGTPREGEQGIQLAAALSSAEASSLWESLVRQRPEIGEMRRAIEHAVVGGQGFYRLRAYSADAHARCTAMKQAGIACFAVS
ncbi:L,D-transpeptidase family protein [Parerythrobacter aurantius]|uniref:L,D-transpeptidase family protein n=1 Tax=Parerythrobacter aurantius TaxID=3127706 RepID=UPI003249CFD5